METMVAGVKIFAMTYAWSHWGVLYIVSTCGDTLTHEEKYMLAFEDDGVVFNTKCSTTHELLISSTNIYH
jgi:hypothetical protein